MSSPISEKILQLGLKTLLDEMERLSQEAKADGVVKTVEFERLAKAISTHLKTIDDVNAHQDRAAAAAKLQQYTAYEDLPPPSPAERARIIKRLQKLYASIDLDAAIDRATLRHERERSDRNEP